MRNLIEHPVTDEEVIAYLRRHLEEITNRDAGDVVVGDMRPTLIERAIDRMIKHPHAPWRPGDR